MRYIIDGKADAPYTQALEKKVKLVNSDEEEKPRQRILQCRILFLRRRILFSGICGFRLKIDISYDTIV